jgi:hypothetical protein
MCCCARDRCLFLLIQVTVAINMFLKDLLAHIISILYTYWRHWFFHLISSSGRHVDIADLQEMDVSGFRSHSHRHNVRINFSTIIRRLSSWKVLIQWSTFIFAHNQFLPVLLSVSGCGTRLLVSHILASSNMLQSKQFKIICNVVVMKRV